jgi:hypothetical protein
MPWKACKPIDECIRLVAKLLDDEKMPTERSEAS